MESSVHAVVSQWCRWASVLPGTDAGLGHAIQGLLSCLKLGSRLWRKTLIAHAQKSLVEHQWQHQVELALDINKKKSILVCILVKCLGCHSVQHSCGGYPRNQDASNDTALVINRMKGSANGSNLPVRAVTVCSHIEMDLLEASPTFRDTKPVDLHSNWRAFKNFA